MIAAHPKDIERLNAWANITGITGAPFDFYLTPCGIRTRSPIFGTGISPAMVNRSIAKSICDTPRRRVAVVAADANGDDPGPGAA
jgi:hypothetical protein